MRFKTTHKPVDFHSAHLRWQRSHMPYDDSDSVNYLHECMCASTYMPDSDRIHTYVFLLIYSTCDQFNGLANRSDLEFDI